MANNSDNILFGLNSGEQEQLLQQMQNINLMPAQSETRQRRDSPAIPAKFGSIKELPAYKHIQIQRVATEKAGIVNNPLFVCHDVAAKNRTVINGRDFLNFATYDYAGLNRHPEVNAAAQKAMEAFGTSAGGSRPASGGRPPHFHLEKVLREALGVEDVLTFVSGHTTNTSTISTILGPRDAIYYDALAHNSIVMGALYSGAARYSFAHNDPQDLEDLLKKTRSKHERVIIATEGLFSMDGSIARLPDLLRLKREYTCFLMLDEAHSIGVLGATGRGCAEHFGLDAKEIDIMMGTLSKTLCGCGGFIAGSAELIELLQFKAPGFFYSVAMPPPIAAACAAAMEIMLREPERIARLRKISVFFLSEAKVRGYDTGYAEGYAIIPIIVRNSLTAGLLSSNLFGRGVNAIPVVYPVVEENQARLRFFLTSEHTEEDVVAALDILGEELLAVQRHIRALTGE